MDNLLYFGIPILIGLYFAVTALLDLDDGKDQQRRDAEIVVTFAGLRGKNIEEALKTPIYSRKEKVKLKCGVREIELLYFDDQKKPVDEHVATKCLVKEYDKKGKQIKELWCGYLPYYKLYATLPK